MTIRLIHSAFAAIMVLSLLAAATPSTIEASQGRRTKRAGQSVRTTQGGTTNLIWVRPTRIKEMDWAGGPGGRDGAPKAPFTFIEENMGGSNPKIRVSDASGREWSVKWGSEVNAEVFASRVAWAAGYIVEPSYFIPSGRIQGVDRNSLKRAKKHIEDDGSFKEARFELRGKGFKKRNDEESWAWNDNPFVGTKELNGLKIILMLTSNWDSKDVRDVNRGSNTASFVYTKPNGTEVHYLFTDWGGSMGKWGGVFGREKWDCKGFAKQTPDFIKGVENGVVQWGYKGQRTDDVTKGISVEDVKWLLEVVGRFTDDQFRDGLRAAGANGEEVECFTQALRQRIQQMQNIR